MVPHHPSTWSRARAFTLVELLVVLAVIGVLAGLLMPAVALVRRSAMQANCASNLRQYGLASLAYANDNDGYAPQIVQYMPNPTDAYIHAYGRYAWDMLHDFGMEKANQASCPTVRRDLGQKPSVSFSSYNYNEPVGGVGNLVPTGNGAEVWIQSRHLASASRPAEIVLWAETKVMFNIFQNNNWSLRSNFRDTNPAGAGNYDHAFTVHRVDSLGTTGLSNWVAGDGHSQATNFTKASPLPRWPGTRVYP